MLIRGVFNCQIQWSEFLELQIKSIDDETKRSELLENIKSSANDLSLIASDIEKSIGKSQFSKNISNTFKELNLNDYQGKLHKQAVFLLPKLFQKLVVTTNYDHILEKLFQFEGSFHPGHTEALVRAIREGKSVLYKLHGDYMEPGEVVLTEDSFKIYDDLSSATVQDSFQIFQDNICLFLGCSLKQDRILEVLQKSLQVGAYHFAIVSCNKSDLDTRRRELGEKNIHTILYPSENHEAVRIILEKFLSIIQPDLYRGLPYHIENEELLSANRFRYDAKMIDFVGRMQELSQLGNFCDDPRRFLWWAITGEGGSGKSRLAFEFGNHLFTLNVFNHWYVFWNEHDISKLYDSLNTLQGNTLFIVDYVQEVTNELGRLLGQIKERDFFFKVRILLLERNGTGIENAEWYHQMKCACPSSTALEDHIYNKQFLQLEPLHETQIKTIMSQYAKKLNNLTLSEKEESQLVEGEWYLNAYSQKMNDFINDLGYENLKDCIGNLYSL